MNLDGAPNPDSSAMPDEGLAWYCVRAKPKQESVAAAMLSRLPGVEVFCPRVRFQRETRRGVVWFVEALFPGYFFAQFDYRNRHREIRHSQKVTGIVHFGDRIPVVSAVSIALLRETFEAAGVTILETPLEVGDSVKVVTGPLAGTEAILTELMPGKERVRVLLELLGGEQRVELDLKSIFKPACRR